MSIVRQARARSGRHGGRGMGAFGDVSAPATPLDSLALQVNRFGPGAPAAYQFHTTPFVLPVATLDLDLASTAMLIYQRRAIDSYAQFADAASSKLISNANAGMADPVAWVTSNLADVTGVIKGYGDSVGLPAAPGTSIIGQMFDSQPLGIPLWGWGAAAVGALLLATRKRRKR